MNNNNIYATENLKGHPKEVIERITFSVNLLKQFEVPGTIADVACGSKEVGEIAKATEFYDYYPCDDTVKFCNLLDPEANRNVQKVDNIYFFHALEHFADTKQTLTILHSFLNSGGRLLITCPNAKYDNNFKPFSEELGHYAYLTTESVQAIAEASGYRVILNSEMNQYENNEELAVVLEKV